jgi:phage-related protein
VQREVIFFKSYFMAFYQKQDAKVKVKIQYVLELIRQVDRVPEKFLKHLTGTRGLYEIRVEHQSNTYRIFCCFDEEKLVVLFHGFQKKSQKTPPKEIERAKKIMQDYFNSKNTGYGKT